MVMWVGVKFGIGICGIVPFCNCSTIISNFRLNLRPIFGIGDLDFSGFSNQTVVLWLGWFPLSTICAAATLPCIADPVRLYCITFRAICPANQKIFQIFFVK